jgi:hypothetical protein
MTVSEVLFGGFRVIYRNWPLILIQLAVQFIMIILIMAFLLFIVFSSYDLAGALGKEEFLPQALFSAPNELPVSPLLFIFFFFLIGVGVMLVNIFLSGGIRGLLRDVLVGKREFHLRKFFTYGTYFFGRLFALSLFFFLTICIFLSVAAGAFGLPIYFLRGCGTAGLVMCILLGLLGLFLYFMVALSLSLVFFYSQVVIVLEDYGVRQAVKNTLVFIKGNLGPVLRLFFSLILCTLGLAFILSFFNFFSIFPLLLPGRTIFLLPLSLLSKLCHQGALVYFSLFSIASTMILYLDLRKERL